MSVAHAVRTETIKEYWTGKCRCGWFGPIRRNAGAAASDTVNHLDTVRTQETPDMTNELNFKCRQDGCDFTTGGQGTLLIHLTGEKHGMGDQAARKEIKRIRDAEYQRVKRAAQAPVEASPEVAEVISELNQSVAAAVIAADVVFGSVPDDDDERQPPGGSDSDEEGVINVPAEWIAAEVARRAAGDQPAEKSEPAKRGRKPAERVEGTAAALIATLPKGVTIRKYLAERHGDEAVKAHGMKFDEKSGVASCACGGWTESTAKRSEAYRGHNEHLYAAVTTA